METKKETFIIVDETGAKKEARLISLFSLGEKKYIIYTFDEIDENEMIKLYVSIFVEKDGVYSFENITDDNEWTKVKDVMRQIAKEGNASTATQVQ